MPDNATRRIRSDLSMHHSHSDDDDEHPRQNNRVVRRNMLAFWILGLCNNFAYVIMLSAAKDILEDKHSIPVNVTSICKDKITSRNCHPISTGSVLLADIVPSLIVKVTAPFYIQLLPFGMRHLWVVVLQAASFFVVALGSSVEMGLFGVVLASIGSGMGEVTYLSLASYFDVKVISSWSSGTGGAGIFGALVYAVMTDRLLLAFTPRNALLSMLIVPIVFSYTYWTVLRIPPSVHRISLFHPSTYIVPTAKSCLGKMRQTEFDYDDDDLLLEESVEGRSHKTHWELIYPLLFYMIPLILVYFGEYFINQGLVELLEFDCSHGFGLGPDSQYRWYQVLYQLGVFISRSSSEFVTVPQKVLPFLAILQLVNAALFTLDAIHYFVPHITVVFAIILYEGLLGGASYVNTFKAIHKKVHPEDREFSMGFVSISDTLGIVFSGFLAIPVHNWICSMPL